MSTEAQDGGAEMAGDGRAREAVRPKRYWNQHVDADGRWLKERPRGEELAALRQGIGREPGSVPAMWRYYTLLGSEGPRAGLEAEHVALTLYGLHQQSEDKPMHRPGVGLGAAVRALKRSDKFSAEALDRRFTATATATSVRELGMHLRGLVTQLKTDDQPLDYDRLERDLRAWVYADGAARVRRRWGADYFLRPVDESDARDPTAKPASSRRSSSRRDQA